MPPTAEDFRNALKGIFKECQMANQPYVYIEAGLLHRKVGGYPGKNHRMPVCCDVMKKNMKRKDEIICEPPQGYGARLLIRYRLPR